MSDFKQINIDQAKQMIDEGKVTIVDIRKPDAYQEAHIALATLISDDNLDEFLRATDKEKPLLCYCYHGFSSQNAAGFFVENGFRTVYSIEGGFEAWRAKYPVSTT